jgi:hypothetical protein
MRTEMLGRIKARFIIGHQKPKSGQPSPNPKKQSADYQTPHLSGIPLAYTGIATINKQSRKKTKYMLHTKLIAIAAIVLTMGTTNSFAGPAHGLNSQVSSAFQKDFSKAELMDYNSSKDYTRLTLKVNDMIVFAYYSENGVLLAVTRNIKSTQLPLPLLLDLKKTYDGYWISELFELSTGGQTTYYMTMENADKKLDLRSVNNDSWETIKKEIKD